MNNLIREAILNIITKQGCKGLITIFDFIKVDLKESINIKILIIMVYLMFIILISYTFYFEDSFNINKEILDIIYESYYLIISMLMILLIINIFKIISIFRIKSIVLKYEQYFLIKVNDGNENCENVINVFEDLVNELSIRIGVNVYTIFTILNKQIKHTLIKLI